MNLREKILAAAFDRLGDFAADVRDAIASGADPGFAASRVAGTDNPTPEDGPTAVALTWTPTWASDIKDGDLIAVTGDQIDRPDLGLRALRVSSVKTQPFTLPSMLGGRESSVVSLLAQDADSGEPHALKIGGQAALRIALDVKDHAPADLGGAS